ncbi:hypothetical protein LXL04_003119 [Taraxacum kok-saghyz]
MKVIEETARCFYLKIALEAVTEFRVDFERFVFVDSNVFGLPLAWNVHSRGTAWLGGDFELGVFEFVSPKKVYASSSWRRHQPADKEKFDFVVYEFDRISDNNPKSDTTSLKSERERKKGEGKTQIVSHGIILKKKGWKDDDIVEGSANKETCMGDIIGESNVNKGAGVRDIIGDANLNIRAGEINLNKRAGLGDIIGDDNSEDNSKDDSDSDDNDYLGDKENMVDEVDVDMSDFHLNIDNDVEWVGVVTRKWWKKTMKNEKLSFG